MSVQCHVHTNCNTGFCLSQLFILVAVTDGQNVIVSTGDRLAVNMFCKLHPMQSLDIYCSTPTCQRLIRRHCVVVDRTHINHNYDLVQKVAPGYEKALLESLVPLAGCCFTRFSELNQMILMICTRPEPIIPKIVPNILF